MTLYYGTVSYNANSGSGAPSSTTIGSSDGYTFSGTLSSTKPSRTYYTFQGWSTSSSASGASYSAGGSFSITYTLMNTSPSVTLYAVWKRNYAYVYYKANGGSGAPSTQSHYAGTSVTLSSTVPTRTGYVFLGWATSSSATSASYSAGGTYSLKTTVTLYAVWESCLSTLSASTTYLGSAMTITIDNYDTSEYTTTIKYYFGDASGTIATKTSATSVSWTPPTSLASQITSASSGTCTLKAWTYDSDGTKQGTSSISVTLKVPSSLAPTVSVAYEDTNSTCSGWGVFVQSRSALTFTVTATGQKSATIASYSSTVNSASYTSASFTTDVLLKSGSNSYSTKVTDSRGLSTTSTGTYTVIAYTTPSVSDLTAERDDDDESVINIGFSYAIASVSSNNAKQYAIDYKVKSSTTWTTGSAVTLSSYSGTVSTSITLDSGTEYSIQIRVIDSFETAYISTSVGASGNILLNSRHEGGLGILMKSQTSNQCDIGQNTVVHGFIDETARRCSGYPTAGWNRVMVFTQSVTGNHRLGSMGTIINIKIGRNESGNEVHEITLNLVYREVCFINERSVSASQIIDQIRYTYDDEYGYIDIHLTSDAPYLVTVEFNISTYLTYKKRFETASFVTVDDEPSGETILATHTFTGSGYVPNQSIVTDYGDLSQTGSRIFLAGDSTSIETSTWTTVATCELTEGIWIVLCTARFSSNATGSRNMIVSTSQDTSSDSVSVNFANIVAPVTGAVTYVKSFDIQVIAEGETKTLYINLWQNSGSTLTSNGRFYAIRIA